MKNINQLDVTCFIVFLMGSTCFEHYYAHHQVPATTMLITTLVVSFEPPTYSKPRTKRKDAFLVQRHNQTCRRFGAPLVSFRAKLATTEISDEIQITLWLLSFELEENVQS